MESTGLLIGGAALAAATAFGLFRRSRDGRVRAVTPQEHAAPQAHDQDRPSTQDAVLDALGARPGAVTLLQFSSAFCAPCRATRVICAGVAETTPGVRHVEVDAESHLDEVRALDIWRTPTVLVVDAAGRVVGRAQGTPTRAQVLAAVSPLLTADRADHPTGETP